MCFVHEFVLLSYGLRKKENNEVWDVNLCENNEVWEVNLCAYTYSNKSLVFCLGVKYLHWDLLSKFVYHNQIIYF